jgi:WD40 repeat protein
MDNAYNIYQFNKKDLTFTRSFCAFKDKAPWHKYSRSVDTSSIAFSALSLVKSTKTMILQLGEKIKKKAVLEWHKSDTSVAAFSPDGTLFATGGEDGRCIFYDGESFNLMSSLFPKPDYISNICYSSDSKLVAILCFDKTFEIFDIERNISVAEFEASSVCEDGFFDDEKKYFFYVTRDGNVGKFDIESKENTTRDDLANFWMTNCKKLLGGKFALICGKDERILAIDTHSLNIVFSYKLEQSGIASLAIDGDKLMVGSIDGLFEIYDFSENKEEMKLKLKEDDIHSAFTMTENNIFLKLSPEYVEAKNRLWEAKRKESIDLLAKNKAEEALKNIQPFLEDKEKKEDFDFYLAQIEDIGNFMDHYEKKEYPQAYKLADQNDQIKALSMYEELEKYWDNLFNTAKKMLQKNPTLYKPKAKELLEPYASVKSKKELIITLLNNADKFTQSEELLKERDFAGYFRLCDKFPFLKETQAYKKAVMIGEQLFDKAFDAEGKKDFDKALNYLNVLGDFTPFKHGALERKKHLENKMTFFKAIKDKDIPGAYRIVEQDSNLASLEEFEALKNDFKKLSKKAYEKAFGGFSQTALEILEDYLDINYWRDKVGSIMKVSYINEIKYGAQKFTDKQVDWNRTLEDYILHFGKDEEFIKTVKSAGLGQYLEKIDNDGDAEGFKKLEYLNSIIAKNESE